MQVWPTPGREWAVIAGGPGVPAPDLQTLPTVQATWRSHDLGPSNCPSERGRPSPATGKRASDLGYFRAVHSPRRQAHHGGVNRIPLATAGQQQPRPAPQRVIDRCDIGPGEQPGDWHLSATATQARPARPLPRWSPAPSPLAGSRFTRATTPRSTAANTPASRTSIRPHPGHGSPGPGAGLWRAAHHDRPAACAAGSLPAVPAAARQADGRRRGDSASPGRHDRPLPRWAAADGLSSTAWPPPWSGTCRAVRTGSPQATSPRFSGRTGSRSGR
jgi:hypothetical protein